MDGHTGPEITLSFVCPIHNAETLIEPFYERLKQMADELAVAYEIIFVNDGSTDESLEAVRSVQRRDGAVRYLDLSRRFGLAAASVAGCEHAEGRAIVIINLERPLDLIGALIERWQGGWEIVRAVDGDADTLGPRLLDHKAARALCRWYDRASSIDAILDEIGFRQTTVPAGSGQGRRRPKPADRFAAVTRPARWLCGLGTVFVAAAITYLIAGGLLALTGVGVFSVAVVFFLALAGSQLFCLAAVYQCLKVVAAGALRGPAYIVRRRQGFGDGEPETPSDPGDQDDVARRFTVLT